jgi:hypothetical protein
MDKSLYLIQLSESPRTDFGKRDFAEQRYEQKVFSAIWELESLVGNGGFQGYFGNGAETANFAPTALRAIGAQKTAAIVQDALALVPERLPADLDSRWKVMHSLPDVIDKQFEALDNQFFAYPDDITELLFAFVAAHPDVFGLVPKSDA